MIADVNNTKNLKLNSIVTELFIIGRKSNISLVFITQSDFKVPKDVRLNTTNFDCMFLSCHVRVCAYHVTYVHVLSLAKWLSVRLETNRLWVRVPLQSLLTFSL